MTLWLAAGKLSELKVTAKALEEYGRRHGFSSLVFSGPRRGWSRVLGFKPTAIRYEKELG
jgi:hypothetical protein